MATYKAVNNVFVNGEVVAAGQTVDLKDDDAKDLLERGSLVEFDENAAPEEPTKPELPGEVVEEFEHDGNSYQVRQEGGRNGKLFHVLNDALVNESVVTSAKQAVVREKLDQERAEQNSATKEEAAQTTPPLDPTDSPQEGTTQPDPANPTPEEIAKTLDETGAAGSTPSSEVELS